MARSVRIGFLIVLIVAVAIISSGSGALGSVGYSIRSSLIHNPGVTAAQIDNYIASVYATSPLVGHSQMWIDAGNKYGIDPVFLMNLAILESGWGFSDIAKYKNNLYGWQAYDTDPYGSARSFPSFEAGTDYVAGKIKELYLTPGGPYYTYYGPTLEGMNVNYATSQTWRFTIATLMNEFASTIPGYNFPQVLDQYGVIYTDVDTPTTMFAGQTYSATVRMWNIGKLTWAGLDPTNPVRLSYHWVNTSTGETVVFEGERTEIPANIAPGQEGIVAARIRAPSTPGTYTLKYDLVREGITWFSWKWTVTLNIRVNVVNPGAYSASYTLGSSGPGVFTSYPYPLQVTLTNTGTMTWLASDPTSPVKLSYHWINLMNGSTEYDGLRTSLPGDVPPGGTVTLNAQIRGPAVPGLYILKLDMVHEGVTWFSWYGTFKQNSPSLDLIVRASPIHPNGTLIKTAGNPAVYLLEEGKRRWITSPASFLSYGFRWDRIITISDAEMSIYPVGLSLQARPGTLLKSETNPAVYVTDLSGETYIKRWITSVTAFENLGYKWDGIITVLDVEITSYTGGASISGLSSHPNGTLIKTAGNPAVYLIEEGKRRWITSPAAFLSNGFRWDRIITISDAEMSVYPEGSSLRARPGTLLKSETNPAVYVTDFSGVAYQKRWISSATIFEALGYRWGDIITISSEELGTYVVGSSVN